MRGTRRTARQSRREGGLTRGIPLALLSVGVLTCLIPAFLPGGGPTDAGRAVAAGQAGAVPGAGPASASGASGVRITGIYGQQLTVNGLALRPDVAQPTGVQFARH